MRICTGLVTIDDLVPFIQAGAEEFYCGVIDEQWLDRYNYIVALNRRPWPDANFSSFAELAEVVNIAHAHGCQVFFTMNEHCYNNQQLGILDYYLEQAVRCEVDAIIFADLGLAGYFADKKTNVDVHISTGGTIFNCYTAEMYTKEFHADRLILPRSLSMAEMKIIIESSPNTEFEVFIKNEGCTYIDGFCNFVHGTRFMNNNDGVIFNPPCVLRYQVIESITPIPYDVPLLEKKLNWILDNKGDCGVCSLYYLNQLSVDSLKLVGRASDRSQVLSDIRMIKSAIDLCGEVANFEEYHHMISSQICQNSWKNDQLFTHCYYPEILDHVNGIHNVQGSV
ncbi:U32 family peptidase [Paenibacillus sp. FSL L8-0638]|uniref:peptidase U32 family protein n=1 Tax=Paenibacillus TaxID=44249 RepID=UPI0031591A11